MLSVEIVSLESKQTQSGRRSLLTIGTGFQRGEDLTTRGRVRFNYISFFSDTQILIYDIIEVVPEIDNPQTNHKFKKLKVADEKGAISSICSVNGYLLIAIGAKIMMYSFDDDESLTGVAFLDVNFYVTRLLAIKNMIIICDVAKSVWFAVFQVRFSSLLIPDGHPGRAGQVDSAWQRLL